MKKLINVLLGLVTLLLASGALWQQLIDNFIKKSRLYYLRREYLSNKFKQNVFIYLSSVITLMLIIFFALQYDVINWTDLLFWCILATSIRNLFNY
jgi:hypothetical protein